MIICKAPGRTQSHDNLAGWQRNIGYVPQTTYLIDDSVRRNVAYGVPEAEIDDERVWLALRTAQVDHLVRSLPAELGAIVGERGGRLSGRTSATGDRATYGDPEVLVIDEATSDLNPVTEAAIVEVVAGLRGKKTRASGGFREKLRLRLHADEGLSSQLRAILGVARERPGFFRILRDRVGGRPGPCGPN